MAFQAGRHQMRKWVKRSALHIAKALGLFALARRFTASGVRILCYHGVLLGYEGFRGDSMFMSPETFERRLDIITRLGFTIIGLDEAIHGLLGMVTLPLRCVVVTIDDGWYSTFNRMLPALASRRMPATLYVDTARLGASGPVPHMLAQYLVYDDRTLDPSTRADFTQATDLSIELPERNRALRSLSKSLGFDLEACVANRSFDYMTAEELRTAAKTGLDIQLHTHNHTLHDFSNAAIASEIAQNRSALAEILNRDPASFKHFCYPSGVTRNGAGEILASLGISSSMTTLPGFAYPGGAVQYLPRLLDGEQLSEIEFEAELSGVRSMFSRQRKPA